MREIKFRVWDEVTKSYDFLWKDKVCLQPDNTLRLSVSNPKITTGKDYRLEQYTGLKDREGKEIFEGDIVKHQQGIDKIQWWESGWYVGEWQPGNLHDFIVTVIGNIHENSELLEDEGK